MNRLNNITAVALSTIVATALLGIGSASGTTLEVYGVEQNAAVTLSATLQSGTSAVLRDTFGFSANTCTSSAVGGKTESPYTKTTTVTGAVSTLSFTNCSDPVTVHKGGKLHFIYTGGTGGTVWSSGAEWTADGPFGYLQCITYSWTVLGTLTASAPGLTHHARMDINATLDCGISAKWVATYTVTSPTGLSLTS